MNPGDPTAHGQIGFRVLVILAFLAALILGAIRASAQTVPQPAAQSAAQPTRRIVISIPDHKLALIENERVVKIYDVAVGALVSPSPDGEYQIARRLENPTYYHPGIMIGPGDKNPLGPRWIGLNVKGFGIHGTNQPGSIGKSASHGCIRMRNGDIRDLFASVKVGDRVSLISERNDEVARLFGPTPDSARDTQTVVAKSESAAAPETDQQGDR